MMLPSHAFLKFHFTMHSSCIFKIPFRISVLIAVAVPSLENIIPLVGITCGSMLALVFPATLDTLTFVPKMLQQRNDTLSSAEGNRLTWAIYRRLAQNVFLVAVGLFSLCVGLEATIKSLLASKGS